MIKNSDVTLDGASKSVPRPIRIASTSPYLPDVGVVALIPDYWDAQWQTRHHVLSRLSRFFRVAWIDPAHEWRATLRRLRAQIGHEAKQGGQQDSASFAVYTPDFWLPQFYRLDWLDRLTFRGRLRRAKGLLTSAGSTKLVLYLWRPHFAPALDLLPHDLSCYHMDDEYTFSDVDLPTQPLELQLIKRVDRVFIHSPGLMEKKGGINPRTSRVPNGVDFQAFSAPLPEPPSLSGIRHPRIGYTGFLKKTLDWNLLLDLSRKHPDWSFVLVGPLRMDPEIQHPVAMMKTLPNVHFLGPQSLQEVAGFAQHFDACILPYRLSDYEKYVYPLKLHEYLATGRPVVGTRIRTLEDFSEVVALANTSEEWTDALQRSLRQGNDSPELRTRRQAVAAKHDWGLLVTGVAKTIASGLGPDFVVRLEKQLQENTSTGLETPQVK